MKQLKFHSIITLIVLVCLMGCASQKKLAQKQEEANGYFLRASAILQNTVFHAISRADAITALDLINQAIELNPKESEYYGKQGTCYNHLKKYDQAILSYEKALQLDPTNAYAWMGKGLTYSRTKHYKEAEEAYNTALKYDTDSYIVYYNLALLYNRWGKYQQSVDASNKAIAIYDKDASAFLNRGFSRIDLKQFNEAINDFDKAIELEPKDKLAYNNKGLCLYQLKEYKKAIFCLKRSLDIDLGDAFNQTYLLDSYACNNLANCYLAIGNTDEACKYWNLALKKGYKYDPAWKARYNIDNPVDLIKKHCK